MADSSHIDSNVVTTETDSSGSAIISVVNSNVIESTSVTSNVTTGGKGEKGIQGDPGLTVSVNSVTQVAGDISIDTDDIPQGTNKFVTTSDLSDIGSNTSARHIHSNKALLDTYDQANSAITNAVAKAHDPVDISGLVPKTTMVNGKTLNSDVSLNELYAPQDRPKPPEITRIIQSFDQTGHTWFNGGTSVSSNPADSDAEVGVHASVVTGTTGTSTYSKYNFGTFDATNMNLVALVRVEDITAISGLFLRIGSDTNVNANYFDLNVSGGNVSSSVLNSTEWVPVTFSWAKSTSNGTPNRSALKSVQFRMPAFNGKSTTVRFKLLGTSEQRGPYCLISFDDNQVSSNLSLPYMNKYGFPGTMYSIAERIDTPNYQTMQDVLSMQNNFNWEIACHSYSIAAHDSTNGMVDLTLPQLDTELKQLKEWALSNKIRGANHFAWPKGRFNPDMLPVAQKYFVSAGMVSYYINQALPTFTPMRMARRGITATTTLADITAEVDTAIANNTSIELLFHKIVPSGATGDTEYNAADFAAVIDYIASSGIPVRTISEAVYGKKQTIDNDLTAIAKLNPSNDDFIQRKSGIWTNRTVTQIKTDLALTKSDVGLSNVDNTSDANKPVSTAQATADTLRVLKTGDTMTGDLDMSGNKVKLNSTAYLDGSTAGQINPTGSFGSTNLYNGASLTLYNTTDQTTNYERAIHYWSSNTYFIGTYKGGTGTLRDISIRGNSSEILVGFGSTNYGITLRRDATAYDLVNITSSGMSKSAGVQVGLGIIPTITQTSTAGYTALLINPTETTTGSGNKLLVDFQVGGSRVGFVNSAGAAYFIDSIQTPKVQNPSSGNNSQLLLTAFGTTINRNIADANPALAVTQTHASSTGDIAQFKNSAGTQVSISQAGVITSSKDIEITDTTKGVILKSPDGTRYRVTVANGGALSTAVA